MAHLPISGYGPFDRFAMPYNVSSVLTPDMRLNATAYEEYSPLFLPSTYVLTYFLAFTMITALLTQTILFHGKTLLNGLKRVKVEDEDIHAKLMRNYPEVPDWWYFSVFAVFFVCAIIAVSVGRPGCGKERIADPRRCRYDKRIPPCGVCSSRSSSLWCMLSLLDTCTR